LLSKIVKLNLKT